MKKIFLILCVLFAIPALAQQPDEADKLIEQGVELHDKGDYEGAIKKYDEALKMDSNNLTAMGEKAYSLHSMNREEDAIALCKKALALYPDSDKTGWIYITLGNSLDVLGRSDEALKVYDDGVLKFPKDNMIFFNKGITLTGLKRYDEALKCMESSATFNPRHPGTQNALGRLLLLKERKIPALMVLVRFMILEPTGSRAAGNLPLIREILGGNVEQTGKKNVTVYYDPKNAGDDGDTTMNNFSIVELTLSLTAALDYDKKYKNEKDHERFIRKFEMICGMLDETEGKNKGFYWEFYAPYFADLKKQGYVETLAYIVFASSGNAVVDKWISEHSSEIDAFYTWSSAFPWKN